MCGYVRAKFKVSSKILTSFRQGRMRGDFTKIDPHPPRQNESLKDQPRLGLK